MRVKRLELQGFKSFKDKTIIHFDHSITGIVGPNGCGKSNIVDAFFWVMGEQSYKHMRGSGSEDLIFNGSTKYSPLGMAEATMVLETDVPDTENAPAGATVQDIPLHLRSKEISVTRRVYRSGEGEYFINGVPARLKDIQELFMDTGVGAKGYSVIEQGAIGKIVNAKPEDRRLLIEEAAGIAKYKARKKESLRKMEATQANLSRLNDVIQEIERNLASLERQAQKARQYRKYKEELFEKEISWGRRKAQVLKQRMEKLTADREALEQELLGLKAELQVSENEIETDRVHQLTDSKLAEDLQSEVQELSGELTRRRSALDLSRRRQGDLASQLHSAQHEKTELETSLTTERETLALREKESSSIEATFAQATAEAQSSDEQARVARRTLEETRRALDCDKRELMNGISQGSELTSRAAALASRAEAAQLQGAKLAQQIQQIEARLAAAASEAETATEAAEANRARRGELTERRRELQQGTQEKERAVRAAEQASRDASNKLTQLRSRLTSLEELAAAHEGFGDGPKAALDWARQSKGEKLAALADALEVSPGYEAALEGWLETRLEDLICESPNLALEALGQLQEKRQGRAAIHLRASSNGPALSFAELKKKIGSAVEIEGQLSDFVKPGAKASSDAQSIAASVIQGVCVVRDLAQLEGLTELHGWALVSRAGMALEASGRLRGGSTESDRSGSLLGRKRAISELEVEVEAGTIRVEETEAVLEAAREALETSRAELTQAQTELQTLEIEGAALERDVHQSQRSLKEIRSQLQQAQDEASDLTNEGTRAREERGQVEHKLSQLGSRRQELEEKIRTTEELLLVQEEAQRTVDSELSERKIREASLRERVTSLKRELDASRSLIGDRERRLAELNRVLERASREREEHTGGDAGLEQGISELTRSITVTQEKLSAAKDRLEQSSAKLNATLARMKELHEQGDSKTSESSRLAVESEKVSGELAHLSQNLDEKYGPGCLDRPITPIQEEMTNPIVTEQMSAEDELRLSEELDRLRERIRRLGEVNPTADQEYEEVNKRYEYLSSEKSDLEHSIKNLEEAIEHINKTSEERFRKAFESIANRFERLFPIVFGGGQASLSLAYPEGSTDILEAGVDIMAQPPGKKVTNIGLLSGGEKALTAVSLIFAIFMVKPSPFCLLDEVDAPLDDANIGKFNALLREMSVKSQFILITHNKKTMELNDTLYGVTMEEPGVSKMVSIEMH